MKRKEDSTVEEKLRPYTFHGVDLTPSGNGSHEAVGTCPWCGREKFSYNFDKEQWKCVVCGTGSNRNGGNVYTFLKILQEESHKTTKSYQEVIASRKFLSKEPIEAWGMAQSFTTKDWLVPGYSPQGALTQLYRYILMGGKHRLLPTPTLGHSLHGVNLYDPQKPTLYVCEGPWDGMILWEILKHSKVNHEGHIVPTSNESQSLLASSNVLAVPGCTTFLDKWLPLFKGKTVNIMFDSDHPKKLCNRCKKSRLAKEEKCSCGETEGRIILPAGFSGVKKLVDKLGSFPEAINYLRWGEEGFDVNLPSGYDVRDYLSEGKTLSTRATLLENLLTKLVQVPEEWMGETTPSVSEAVGGLECVPCDNYESLVQVWKKAMYWTDGLDHGLSCMLASVASTKSLGDPVWLKVQGPAASGKTTLCEALSIATQYVVAKSTIRGFHSGFRSEDGEDFNLLTVINGKTLVTKDGDTLLQSPNLGQILSEARDIYDGASRSHYLNGMGKDHTGLRVTWLLCGTSSLKALDSSELGERFLDCIIMEEIDDELEDKVLELAANKAVRNLAFEAGTEAASQQDPDLTQAMQLTGGYVNYLRDNATNPVKGLSTIAVSKPVLHRCGRLAKLVSHMRARPSTRQDETAEREFSSRLVVQLARLATCLAYVFNRKEVDAHVMSRIIKVAIDTCKGPTYDITTILYDSVDGRDTSDISTLTNLTLDKAKNLLRFLRKIKVVELRTSMGPKGHVKTKYHLTNRMRRIYREATGRKEVWA